MSNLTTTQDLVTYILEGMREKTDGTSPWNTKALTQLNRCYRALASGGIGLGVETGLPVTFPWARAQWPKVVTLSAPISTGTVSVTLGSTGATLSSGPASSVAGWHLRVDGEPEVYRVTAHTAGDTALTLDSAYVGTDNATAAYRLFKIRYQLSADVLALCSPLVAYASEGSHEIDVVAKTVLNRDYPLNSIEQEMPTRAGVVFQQEGVIEVQLNAYPAQAERVEADYIAIPTALDLVSSDPIMPLHQRIVAAEFALAALLEEVDDDRAGNHLTAAKNGFEAMVEEARGLLTAGSRGVGKIIPRLDEYGGSGDFVRTEDGFIIEL